MTRERRGIVSLRLPTGLRQVSRSVAHHTRANGTRQMPKRLGREITVVGSWPSVMAPTARRLLLPQMRTSEASVPDSEFVPICSLIPGLEVKLSAIILAGRTVLSAVGASPPHDGIG